MCLIESDTMLYNNNMIIIFSDYCLKYLVTRWNQRVTSRFLFRSDNQEFCSSRFLCE
uniref:Uncharacterized protein n=1 Tax=Ciona intestinalis TaxID=7719 RepID=H2XNU0_CIOIN